MINWIQETPDPAYMYKETNNLEEWVALLSCCQRWAKKKMWCDGRSKAESLLRCKLPVEHLYPQEFGTA